MADRPWVIPDEVREYSEIKQVQQRSDKRLEIDISRAEQKVISYTNNKFTEYSVIPAAVKTAVILLAEAYGYNTFIATSGKKSETFDDYSYTADTSGINVGELDIESMLDEFCVSEPRNGVTMRLRKL